MNPESSSVAKNYSLSFRAKSNYVLESMRANKKFFFVIPAKAGIQECFFKACLQICRVSGSRIKSGMTKEMFSAFPNYIKTEESV